MEDNFKVKEYLHYSQSVSSNDSSSFQLPHHSTSKGPRSQSVLHTFLTHSKLKILPNQLLTQPPKPFRIPLIKRPRRHKLRVLCELAITQKHTILFLLQFRIQRSPQHSRATLLQRLERNLLPLPRPLLDLLHQLLVHIPTQVGIDATRMQGIRPDARLGQQPLVERKSEEHVGHLGLAVGVPGFVLFRTLGEAGVVPADAAAEDAALGGDVDDLGLLGLLARFGGCSELGQDVVRQDEVAEVGGGELQLETVDGEFLGGGHDGGIVDDDVDVGDGCVVEDLTGGFTNAVQRGEIRSDELDGDGWVDGVNRVDGRLDLAEGAAHEDEQGWVAVGKRDGCFRADTSLTWAGDED